MFRKLFVGAAAAVTLGLASLGGASDASAHGPRYYPGHYGPYWGYPPVYGCVWKTFVNHHGFLVTRRFCY